MNSEKVVFENLKVKNFYVDLMNVKNVAFRNCEFENIIFDGTNIDCLEVENVQYLNGKFQEHNIKNHKGDFLRIYNEVTLEIDDKVKQSASLLPKP